VGEASADAVTVEVKKDVARRELFPSIGIELSTPACSNAGRQNTIASALADARALAGGAATDILSHPNGNEYNTYFGGNTQSDIWFNMDRIAGDLSSSGVRQ
jgi:deuterolysin